MASEESVKVAVRVRPFNGRERSRNAALIIDMQGATTSIQDPNDPGSEPKKFAFDYSYWSHDGCKADANGYFAADPSHPNGKKFCDQKRVYNDLGAGILENAWEGYNSTLFAYGQTGSGKSWSIVGYGINRGVVPQFCEAIFQGIDSKKSSGENAEYEVTFSMLEIYNEQVRDLLDPKGASKKGGLRIRQHPKNGFYAESLQVVPVVSYADIEKRMEEGTTNRTVAATNMNATSRNTTTGDHYTGTVLAKVVAAVQEQRPNMGTARTLLLHDNAAPFVVVVEGDKLHVLPHSACTPDLAPRDSLLLFTLILKTGLAAKNCF